MKQLFLKYRSIIMYIFFGGCTTIINLATYYLFHNVLSISNVPATIIAWLLAVIFAFVTNKLWVFDSKSWEKNVLLHELWTFFAARIATGIFDVVIMYLAVDVMNMNSTIWKLISNIIVIILNYIASKLVIFNR